MILYIEVSKDEYELPLAVADTIKELAKLRHISESTIFYNMSCEKKGTRKSRFKKIVVEDEL